MSERSFPVSGYAPLHLPHEMAFRQRSQGPHLHWVHVFFPTL